MSLLHPLNNKEDKERHAAGIVKHEEFLKKRESLHSKKEDVSKKMEYVKSKNKSGFDKYTKVNRYA